MITTDGIVILNCDEVPDKDNELISIDGLRFENRVPVRGPFNMPVGWATLRKQDSNVLAKLEIVESFNSKGLYPAIAGRVLKKTALSSGVVLVDELEIHYIMLGQDGNADTRIAALP